MVPVITLVARKEIAAGFALAGFTLCAGFYFSMLAGQGGTALFRIFGVIAYAIVLKYTVALGQRRGFPLKGEGGQLHTVNLARNLVASAMVFVGVIWLSGLLIIPMAKALR